MSKKPPRLPRTPRSCSSPVPMETAGSGSSRSSDSPIHWETLFGPDSQKTTKIKPSSWDNSDDELPLTLEKDIPRGHIYSSESLSNRKSVAAEIDELKKQFFQAVVTETVADLDELREKLETSLRNDRRQSPARVRRRTKSSSSSSTVMDIPGQNSPKKGDDFDQQYEAIFDSSENTAPILELDSRFYLDNFFAELRRKRISILESTIEIANERDEDFQEIAPEDSNEFINLNDCGYYNRSSRKLSQILEVEENKKDSDKEECSENTDLFLKFSRKPEGSDCSPLHNAESKKDEKLFENLKEKEYEFKFSSVGLQNSKKPKHRRDATAIASELEDEVISLTAKTGTIQLTSPKQKDVKKNSTNLNQIFDDDVNWSLIENLKLDLMRTPENSTPRKISTREKNSGSGSNRSTRDVCSQSPKFLINLGKESSRSLKVEEIKSPNSIGRHSVAGSDRSIKDPKSSSGSAVHEAGNILLDLKSPSLGSRTSNQSLELQHILLDQGLNTGRYSGRSDCVNESRDEPEPFNGPELPYRSNHSECSSRSVNSKSSRSSRSYRHSSRAIESRMPSQRSQKLKNLELLEGGESRRSSLVSSTTESGLLRQTSTAGSDKSRVCSSRNRKGTKMTMQGTQTATPRTNKSFTEDVCMESKGRSETFDNNEGIPGLVTSEWIDVEKVQGISSNRSEKLLPNQPSSRSEIISESVDKKTQNDFTEEPPQSRNSSRKSVITENSDNLDNISSSRSTKDKSRLSSCRSEERALLNIPLNSERSDEIKVSGRSTDRSGMLEECEDTPTQTLQNDSESDRRLSVIDEASFEDIALSNICKNPMRSKQPSAIGSEGNESGRTPKNYLASYRSVQDELITKSESEGLWNDLIETFSADQDQPFNWQDNFLGFLNTNHNCSVNPGKEPLSPVVGNAKFLELESCGKEEEDDDLVLSKRLRENVCRSPSKSEKILSPKKLPEKKEDFLKNLDLGLENNLTKKIKSDNDAENLYYFNVQKTGNFGIGEFGDVKCWNLGVSHTLEEGKPKGDGDGTLSQYHKETPILKQDSREKNSKTQKQLWINLDAGNPNSKAQKPPQTNDDLNLISFSRNDLKTSKSDNWINTIEYSQCAMEVSSTEKNKSNSEQKPLVFDTSGKKRRVASSTSSVKYSSSECFSDETDNQELYFESVRRTASLTDIAAQLSRTGYEKLESNESLYDSRSRLFEKVRKEKEDKDTTNLNIFLARKKEEDKTEAKSNWLILKQPQGKTCHRENKKSKSRLKIDKSLIKKDSKEYLSFKSRPSIPTLKLRESNCFQNFYKRVISVFCLTSNSSLPTSK